MLRKTLSSLQNNKILIIILLLAFTLRFWDLGYSNFYGDETKTFYIDKTQPAKEFFLNQRKGPIQFFIVWITEKIIGGHDELITRLPFATAGFLSVYVFYLVVKKAFNTKVAIISTALFAFNGLYIAFSKTIQYQSVLVLFGLLSIYFIQLYSHEFIQKRRVHMVLSAVFLALAYLSHYDAVFFDVVVAIILLKMMLEDSRVIKEVLIYYGIPFLVLVGIFYLPYFLSGYYEINTVNYVERRLVGTEYTQNLSWYTFFVYNPLTLWATLSVFVFPYLWLKQTFNNKMTYTWFLIPFILFQFIFTNPGTHIHNYLLPLFIIIAVGITETYELIKSSTTKLLFGGILSIILILIVITDFHVYTPKFNKGYPWKSAKSRLAYFNLAKIDKSFHLFLYGFPYDRGWKQIREYILQRGGVHGVYTNDNDTVARYYLREIAYTKKGSNFYPEFYIHVYDNQEFTVDKEDFYNDFLSRYTIEKEFYVDGELSAILYKLDD